MSNALAIATVTATMRRNIQIAIDAEVGGAKVTTVRPDASGNGTPSTGVNIYLFQITSNASWRNADLPTRRAENGTLIQQPRTALDLHYVLTFYGDETRLQAQHLAAIAARTLHARPTLTRAMIQDTLADPTFNFLAGSNLADEVESVKFTPMPLSLEELSRLWSVLLQTPYALSMVYQGSVVFIDAQETPQTALPVRERKIYVSTFRQPRIESVQSDAGPRQAITTSSTLVIAGQQLKGEDTQIRFGDLSVSPQSVEDDEVRLTLATVPAGSLRAGVQGLQILSPLALGEPPTPHPGVGVESNVAAFVLCPTIIATASVTSQVATDFGGTTLNLCDGSVTVTFDVQVGKTQRVVLLLNEINAPVGLSSAAYSFEAPSRNQPATPETTTQIAIPLIDVREGEYLVRAQVDGAQSPLQRDENPASPTFNQWIAPKVVIA